MFETLRNVWKIEELRKKVLYTVFMLILYRLLCVVPVPGVDLASVQEGLETFSLLQFMNSITGSNLQMYTIMAMGISPYINASIIMQLLTVAIPKLEEMNKSGEEGRKKIAQITRYVTVALGFLQAVALTSAIGAQASGGTFGLITIGFCMAAGTALAMWIGERITENGIGNGISLLIFAGIISNFANQIAVGAYNAWHMPSYLLIALPVLIISLVLIVAVTCVDLAERRVPVQYAKRVVGRKMYGGQSTHIPLKVNSSGVLAADLRLGADAVPADDSCDVRQQLVGPAHQCDGLLVSIGVRAVDHRLHVLLFVHFLQSGRNCQEYAAKWRQHPGHSPGQAHCAVYRQDHQAHQLVWRAVPRSIGDDSDPDLRHRERFVAVPGLVAVDCSFCGSRNDAPAGKPDSDAPLQGLPEVIEVRI